MDDLLFIGFTILFYGTILYRCVRYGVKPTIIQMGEFTRRLWEGPNSQPQLEGSLEVDCRQMHKTLALEIELGYQPSSELVEHAKRCKVYSISASGEVLTNRIEAVRPKPPPGSRGSRTGMQPPRPQPTLPDPGREKMRGDAGQRKRVDRTCYTNTDNQHSWEATGQTLGSPEPTMMLCSDCGRAEPYRKSCKPGDHDWIALNTVHLTASTSQINQACGHCFEQGARIQTRRRPPMPMTGREGRH